jgi:hypothetical protein
MWEMGMSVIELDLEGHKLIEAARLTLKETQLCIIKRALKGAAKRKPRPARTSANTDVARRTGHYLIRMGDRQEFAASQKDAYIKLLSWLRHRTPGMLERLADEQTRRGRRIVARSASALYPRPGLELYAEEIGEGWWADLNLSKVQKQQRLKLACRLAGVSCGPNAEAYAEI